MVLIMVRILLAGVAPPNSHFPIIDYSHGMEIFSDDILFFSASQWNEVKNLFSNSIIFRGISTLPMDHNMAIELLNSKGYIKLLPDNIGKDFDTFVSQTFGMCSPNILNQIPVPIMIFNLNAFIRYVKEMSVPDGVDLTQYLKERPDIVNKAGSLLKILFVNPLGVELYEGRTERDVINYLETAIHTYENMSTIKLIQLVREGDFSEFHVITRIRTLKGRIKIIKVNWLSRNFEPGFAPAVLIDITHDQEKFEKAEQTSRVYNQIFEDSPIAITIANSRGVLIFANHAFEEMIGYYKEELIGRPFTDFTHPDFIDGNLKDLKDLMEGRTTNIEFEKKYIRKTGEEIWMHLKTKRISEPIMGEPASIALIEDITSQKIIEEVLETEQDHIQSILEKAPVGMLSLEVSTKDGPEFIVRSMNKKARDLFMVSHMRSNLGDLTEYIIKQSPALFSQLKSSLSLPLTHGNEEPLSFSFIVELHQLQFRVMATSFFEYANPNPRLILFFYDLTSEIEIINEYRNLSLFSEILGKHTEFEDFFSSALRFLGESFDATTAVLHSKEETPAYTIEAIVEYSPHGLIEHIISTRHPYVLPIVAQVKSSSQMLYLNVSSLSIASILGKQLGDLITMPVSSVMISPLHLHPSENWIVVMCLHDASSAQNLLERKFQNMVSLMQLSFNKLLVMEALKQELILRKDAEQRLMAQAEELSQLNRDLEQFVYAASHDLQEPLRTISSYLDLVKMKIAKESSSEILTHIETAIAASKRLKGLITDLRNYSMIGREELEFSNHPLKVVLQAAVKNILHQITKTDSEVVIKVEDHVCVYGNFSLLVTLFQNIISNGLKYNLSEKPTVTITFIDLPEEIQINLADNGIGINKKHFGKIFQAFTRLHSRSEFDGIGMGLAICAKIVQVHEGRIDLESDSNGTTFMVKLPKGNVG